MMRAIIILALVAAAAAPAPPVARSRDASGVRAFIEHVYAGYPRRTPWPENEFQALFAPELRELLHRNDTYSPDEVGPLDGDPICQCQDDTGFSHRIVAAAVANDQAEVVVRNRFGPPAQSREELLTYRLRRIEGAWRIDDIATDAEPSMKAWLRRELDKPR